jgi:hypothetical protein
MQARKGRGLEENKDARTFAVNRAADIGRTFSAARTLAVDDTFRIAGSLLWRGPMISARLFLSAGDYHQVCAWGIEWMGKPGGSRGGGYG